MPKFAAWLAVLACLCFHSPAFPSTPDWVNVREQGAVGDGKTDDTRAFQSAIDKAGKIRGTVFIPVGKYLITRTLEVTRGDFFGCRLEGSNAEGSKILSRLEGTDPVFKFRGGSGRFSNVGLRNLTLAREVKPASKGTGIYIDGQCFGLFENIRLSGFAYGIWLRNHSPGAFAEGNLFQAIQIDDCANGIRMEMDGGIESFHGNAFMDVFINVGEGQTGFNHVSGYYYNGRFRMSMWAHGNTSVFLNADGNAERNIGDITYESGDGKSSPFGRGRLTGTGRFWYSGTLRGIGPLEDATRKSGRDTCQKVFACDNFWRESPYGNSGMVAGPLRGHADAYNGPLGFFQTLRKPGVEAVLLNTYSGLPEENGLYLGASAFQCGESQGKLGLFLGGDGSRIRSYSAGPLRLEAESVSMPGGAVASGFWSQEANRQHVVPLREISEKLNRINPVRYKVPSARGDSLRIGLSVGEVEREFPELVRTAADGSKAIDYGRLGPILVAALQEQATLLRVQEARLSRLDSLLRQVKPAGR